MIRPQMKAKEHKALLEALARGDEVVQDIGCIWVADDFVTVNRRQG